jgi:hypothetical protein
MNLPHTLDGLLALLQVGRGGDGVRAETALDRAHKVRPLTLQQLYPRRTASTVLTVGRDHTARRRWEHCRATWQLLGVKFNDGIEVVRSQAQTAAA